MTLDNDLKEAMELSKQTAFNLATVSEQMGIIQTKLQKHDIDIRESKEEVKSIRSDFEQYKEYMADSQYIEPKQAEELHQAILTRVAELLSPLGDNVLNKYFGRFTSRAWNDAKKSRLIYGTKGVYTPKRNFNGAKEYINSWTPYKYGVDGYIEHLNSLHK